MLFASCTSTTLAGPSPSRVSLRDMCLPLHVLRRDPFAVISDGDKDLMFRTRRSAPEKHCRHRRVFPGEAVQLPDTVRRFGAGAVRPEEVLQTEFLQLLCRPLQLVVIQVEKVEAADRGIY